jgi:hypothetical protein
MKGLEMNGMKNLTDDLSSRSRAWRLALLTLLVAAAGFAARADANILLSSPSDLKLICHRVPVTTGTKAIPLTLTISQWGDRHVQIGRSSYLATQIELRRTSNGRALVFGADTTRPIYSCRAPQKKDMRGTLAKADWR